MGRPGRAGHPPPPCTHLRAAGAPRHRGAEERGCAVRGSAPQPAPSPRGLPGSAKSLQPTEVPGGRTQARHELREGKATRPRGERPAGLGCLRAPAPRRQAALLPRGRQLEHISLGCADTALQAAPNTALHRFLGTFQAPSQGRWVIPASGPRTPPSFEVSRDFSLFPQHPHSAGKELWKIPRAFGLPRAGELGSCRGRGPMHSEDKAT